MKCKYYNKLEPINGNINSGEDDNVESLTGNDVGTEKFLAARE